MIHPQEEALCLSSCMMEGAKVTGAFTLQDGKVEKVPVKVLCSFCDEPATHLVAARYYPEHYDLLCAACVVRGLAEGWYPYGVKIRKRKV